MLNQPLPSVGIAKYLVKVVLCNQDESRRGDFLMVLSPASVTMRSGVPGHAPTTGAPAAAVAGAAAGRLQGEAAAVGAARPQRLRRHRAGTQLSVLRTAGCQGIAVVLIRWPESPPLALLKKYRERQQAAVM